MFYPQLPSGRHSGAAPGVVILAKPESPYWSLFVFVRHSGAARISVVAFVAPLHFRIQNKTHRINILPASLRE
jgi:hypothetical protein